MKTKAFSAGLFALALGAGTLATATPAYALPSVAEVSDGELLAKGVTVKGTYKVYCENQDDGARVEVRLDLRQRTGGKSVNSTSYYDYFYCVGGETLKRSYNFSSGTPFKTGSASITGQVTTYYWSNIASESVPTQEINIVKG